MRATPVRVIKPTSLPASTTTVRFVHFAYRVDRAGLGSDLKARLERKHYVLHLLVRSLFGLAVTNLR